MFDEMVIRTNFMKKCISKVLSMYCKKALGNDIHINLDELEMHTTDGEITLKLNGSVKMNLADFEKLMLNNNRGA